MKKTFDILCARYGISRKDAAEQAGFSVTNYPKQMREGNFNFKKLQGLAKVFNITLLELVAVYEQEEGGKDETN